MVKYYYDLQLICEILGGKEMKRYFNMTICFLLIFLFSGCLKSSFTETKRVAAILNEKANFDFDLLEDMSKKMTLSDYAKLPGFGVYSLCHRKYLEGVEEEELNFQLLLYNSNIVYYEVTSWPDYASGGSYLTRIYCSDHLISLFNFTLDSSIREIKQVLIKENYQYSSEKSIVYLKHIFYNAEIKIYFFSKDDVIEYFVIEAIVTNRHGIVF